MKFNKELHNIIIRYNKIISYDNWFEYKNIKKKIKNISIVHNEIIKNIKNNNYDYEDEECCICFENNNLMKTFCCHKYIHHKCLVYSLAFSNSYCPLCRETLGKTLSSCDTKNEKEIFDAKIISLISVIHLNIRKIENFYNTNNNKIIPEYKKINYKALIKICKKINKKLCINLKEYFLLTVEKKGILKETPTQNGVCQIL